MVLTELSLDYSNRGLGSQKDPVKEMNREEMQQKENMLFSSQEFAQKLQKENMTLMKALAHRNKIVELSGIEFQKLRINLRSVQEKNLQLAQANSQMLAELNTSRDRLKELQHELGCKNALLKVKKQLEEQTLPRTDHASKDKVHDMNQKDTKRKRTSRIKPSGSADVKPIHVNEKAKSKRRVSGVIDTTVIPEETCQTKDDIEKEVVSGEENQIIDNVVNKKFVLDAANPGKDSVHRKRQCTRRQSTRFDVQETEQTEKMLEMDAPKETNETARLSRQCTRRQSTRFDVQETEPTEKLLEMDAPKETNETARLSRQCTRRQSTRFDVQETEPTEKLLEMDAPKETNETARLSRQCTRRQSTRFDVQETEPTEKLLEMDAPKETNETARLSRQCTRRQSTRFDVQETEPTENLLEMDAPKETNETARLSLRRRSARLRPEEAEPCKSFNEGIKVMETTKRRRLSSIQRSARFDIQVPEVSDSETLNADDARSLVIEESLGSRSEAVEEPSESRGDTKETNQKRRVSTRRQSRMVKSQTDEAIKEIATDQSLDNNIVQECDHQTESKDKPKADEHEGMTRRSSVGRPSRHAAEKVQSYREVSRKVKLRRQC